MTFSSISRNNSRGGNAPAAALLCLLLLSFSLGIASGFSPRGITGHSKKNDIDSDSTGGKKKKIGDVASLSASSAPASSSDRGVKRSLRMSAGDKRRAVLAKLATTVATSAAFLSYRGWEQEQKAPLSLSSLQPGSSASFALGSDDDDGGNVNRLPLLSLDQAVKVLEAGCDRRFLHAVVAADYKLMYRGIPKEVDSKLSAAAMIVENEPSDLLSSSTYGSAGAAEYFRSLDDKVMAGKPIRPSNGHIATTCVAAAKEWGGYAASVWPLSGNAADDGDVHFAWPEGGGDFWPSAAAAGTAVVVDGVDCGKDSLDYALERDSTEIMFRADRYLLVPVSMEDRLVSRLRNAFLI